MKVHADNFTSKEFEGKSRSKYPYKDDVVEVDAYIGDIVKALDDAGVLDNTFVFITSDNGPQLDSWPDSGYTPFRGAKASAWEGGIRVPGIAYWRGVIKPARESDELFDLMDLFNTSLHVAGRSIRSRTIAISTASTRHRSCWRITGSRTARKCMFGASAISWRCACMSTRFT
jgi:arylsulfatase A-like enzyme